MAPLPGATLFQCDPELVASYIRTVDRLHVHGCMQQQLPRSRTTTARSTTRTQQTHDPVFPNKKTPERKNKKKLTQPASLRRCRRPAQSGRTRRDCRQARTPPHPLLLLLRPSLQAPQALPRKPKRELSRPQLLPYPWARASSPKTCFAEDNG